jgi:DNA-binding MarR family transcriptional regulator
MTTADSYPLDAPAAPSAAEIAAAWRRERPQTPAESITLVTPLWRLAKLLADDRRRTLTAAGVDAATLDLLSTLRRAGTPYELSTRELAVRTMVTAGAISQRVARAERDALVSRAPAAGRRRAVLVRLTDAGHRVIENTVDDILSREDELVSGLSVQQRAQLAELLDVWLRDVTARLASS